MFLSEPLGFRKRAERPDAVPWGLTVLMVLAACSSANTEPPFTPGRGYSGDAAIPEAASRWGETFAPPRDRTVSQCLWVRLTRPVPGRRGIFTGQCGQPFCPGEATSHLVGSQHRTVVLSPGSPARWRTTSASARLGAWHSHAAEVRRLPNCPCLAPSSWTVAGPRWLRTFP